MLTLIFMIIFFAVFGKLVWLALKFGWGMIKIAAYLIFLPAIVLMMIFGGFMYLALPVLIIVGLAGMLGKAL